jgi:tetratricopeptide (TPR) repeat protein
MIALGDFDRALSLHTEALEIYTGLGEEDERAAELSALGGLYYRMGDAQRALETLQAASIMQERISDSLGLTGTLRLAGNAASLLEQHALALEYLRHSARIDGNPHSVARTNVLIAGELRSVGALTEAEAELVEPLRSANQLVLASALEERARVRLARHQADAAIEDLRSADAHYATLGLEINRIDTQTTLSQALLGAGDVRGAVVAADQAIAIVGRVRVKSANPEWRARFLSARYAPYEARIAAEMATRDPQSSWRAFRVAEDVRARSLADELAVGAGALRTIDPEETALRAQLTSLQLGLEARLGRPGADESTTQTSRRAIEETRAQIDSIRARHGVAASQSTLPESLERVQAALPKDTAVLAYFVGDGRGHAWLLSRDTLRYAELPDRASLEHVILAAQGEERGGTTGRSGRSLGKLLLGSLLDGLSARRLLVLADGPLNSVPFAALPIPGRDDELLIDRVVIASAPSLALAMSSPAHARTANTRVAVVSDPVYSPDDRRLKLAMGGEGRNLRSPPPRSSNNLSRLPFSSLEAGAVQKAFGAEVTIQLSGFDAVPERVFALPARELAVLHFATHAVARSDSPDQSALFLSEYARDGSLVPNSRVTASDIARSGLRADVVVLSGCATGDGRALRGEGVLGLTYGFLANGSQSVVASLWPIEDASTARFMNEFYRDYRASGNAADALRGAQLRVRATGKSGVWSSFVVRANEFP